MLGSAFQVAIPPEYSGDHANLIFDFSGLDLSTLSYTVQAGDAERVGVLQTMLFPGMTIDSIYVPQVGQKISIPAYAGTVLTQLVRQLSALVPGLTAEVSLPSHLSGLRWLGRLGSTQNYTSLNIFRQQASTLARYFAGGPSGAGTHLGEITFEDVTQGRAGRANYSACGDLINFVSYRMGSRDPSFVCRNGVGTAWADTKNISRPVGFARRNGQWRTLQNGEPQPGDLVLIGQFPNEQEHVFVLLDIQGDQWTSADYGQKTAESGYKPSSAIVTRTRQGGNLVRSGRGRSIVGWIDLESIPLAASPDLSGVPQPWPGASVVVAQGPCANVQSRSLLRVGSRGPDVTAWEQILLRDAKVSGATFALDDSFGPQVDTATRAWQSAYGIVPDGVVGPATWAAACTAGFSQASPSSSSSGDGGNTGVLVLAALALLGVGLAAASGRRGA